jgi:hypothetical protein
MGSEVGRNPRRLGRLPEEHDEVGAGCSSHRPRIDEHFIPVDGVTIPESKLTRCLGEQDGAAPPEQLDQGRARTSLR